MNTAREKLLKALRTTAAASFNASKRLEMHDKKLTRLTAFASAYVIILTILPYFVKSSTEVTDLYNFTTVVFSIVILISSLLQYSSNNIVNSEQHHRSGLEMNELYRLLLLEGEAIDRAALSDFTTRYSAILQKYSINHDQIDYRKVLLERPEDNPWMSRAMRAGIRFQIARNNATPDLFLICITILIVVMIWHSIAPQLSSWIWWHSK